MKRLLPWLMGVGLFGAGCSPKNDVQPGAPVLTLMTIVESGGITDITGKEPDCGGGAQDSAMCDPMADSLCRSAGSWCRCLPTDPMDMTKPSNWSCLFEPTSMVIATFDRLLDTGPLDYDTTDPTKPQGVLDVASFTATVGTAPSALAEYVSSGSETGLIFKLLSNVIHGPRLIIAGTPALPSGSGLTLSLDKTKIRAKDHTSFFVSSGAIQDGVLTFATAPLSVGIDVPLAPPTDAATTGDVDAGASDAEMDAAGDAPPVILPTPVMAAMQPVTITFNNVTDPTQIMSAVSVTVSGVAFTKFDLTASDMNPLAYVLTPTDAWPAGSVIVVTVSADAADVQGVPLGAAATAVFATEP
ncbi:MAG TPA: Ig-like domain-containing protein [Polyangia bacterium]|jgi:hypothetical protein|nr:Ig-like domain-containing protein [Polyangia bacterium]